MSGWIDSEGLPQPTSLQSLQHHASCWRDPAEPWASTSSRRSSEPERGGEREREEEEARKLRVEHAVFPLARREKQEFTAHLPTHLNLGGPLTVHTNMSKTSSRAALTAKKATKSNFQHITAGLVTRPTCFEHRNLTSYQPNLGTTISSIFTSRLVKNRYHGFSFNLCEIWKSLRFLAANKFDKITL